MSGSRVGASGGIDEPLPSSTSLGASGVRGTSVAPGVNEDVPAGRKEDCEGVAVGEDNGVPRKAEGNEEDPEKYASMCSESVKSRMKCPVQLA